MSICGQWIDMGVGTLLHPVSKRPVSTRIVEDAGIGRIFEVFDESNHPEDNFRLILSAPKLLSALETTLEALHNETLGIPDSPWIRQVKERARESLAEARGE